MHGQRMYGISAWRRSVEMAAWRKANRREENESVEINEMWRRNQ
jgi:hypothetical protein